MLSRVFFTLAVAVFGVAAAANGIDRLSFASPGLEGGVPGPFRAQADRAAAQTMLVRGDGPRALTKARRAIASDPVDPDSTALLGSALVLANDEDGAARAFRIAARFGWRNVATQAYWFDASMQAGDIEHAADRADALLRTHPRLVDNASLLGPLETREDGRRVLAEHLSARPKWLQSYLDLRSDTPVDQVNRRYLVLSAMRVQAPLGCSAVARFSNLLLSHGRWNDAVGIWNRNCPASPVEGALTDRNFASLTTSNWTQPFGWLVNPSGDVTILEHGENATRYLELTNSASSMRLVVSQASGFSPGRYRIRVTPNAASSARARNVFLSWACGNERPSPKTGDGNALAEGQVINVTQCDGPQRLGLWLSGNGASVELKAISYEKAGPPVGQ